MKSPDFTPVQITAALTSLVGLLVTQGLITNHSEKTITGLAAILVPIAWQLADAIIRHGRSKVAAASIQASGAEASAVAWQAVNDAAKPAVKPAPRKRAAAAK
jgi:predicted histidine transporter YuiF (NhaC family)